MTVTQDYKKLTLTMGERVQVESALKERETFWLDALNKESEPRFVDLYSELLGKTQSALAKVRA